MIAREEQRYVDRHTSENGFLDRPSALPGSRNLDKQIGPGCGGMKRARGFYGPLRIISKERRDFERDPAVDASGPLVDRPEQIRGLLQIRDRKLEEQILTNNAAPRHRADVVIVCGAFRDRMIEDRRVRRQPRDR